MAPQSDKVDRQRPEVASADDRQYNLAADIVAIQRERNDLAGRFLEIGQQENQRHYAFLSEQLKVQDEQNKRSHRLARLIVGGVGFVLLLLLYMVFFGSEAQVGKAEKILTEGAKALGGAGFIFLVWGGLKRLINR